MNMISVSINNLMIFQCDLGVNNNRLTVICTDRVEHIKDQVENHACLYVIYFNSQMRTFFFDKCTDKARRCNDPLSACRQIHL